MKYYLPGCDVRRNHPEAVHKTETYMASRGFIEAQCCRKDLSFLKEGDEIIYNCTLCELMLAERVPGIRRRTLYEYLAETGFEWPDYNGLELTLQDCFRTRDNHALHNALRFCLTKMNITVIETEKNRETADFCGVWLNNPPAEDCVRLAPETFALLDQHRRLLSVSEQEEAMRKHAAQYQTELTAVYCNGCEKGIRMGGGKPVHMIELLTRDL